MAIIEIQQNANGKMLNTIFSEIVLHDEKKYGVHGQYEVSYKGNIIGQVEIIAIRVFKFCDIRDALSFLNSGKPAALQAGMLRKLYEKNHTIDPDTLLDHLVLKWTARHKEYQTHLFNEFFRQELQEPTTHL